MSYPIPRDAFDDRIAIVGTAGSGKTYLTMGAMEHLLARKSRVIGVDPLGVMWGLRLCADGKTPSPFQPVIFGGAHGDLPISEHSGALIGEAVAASSESCIIDLSLLGAKAAERRFMLAFLTALYRYTNKEPVHLVIDEADMFAPQRLLDKDGDAAKLLGMMETIVRRGRVKGFIPWLITQRPAVLSKDVLSQADGLVALKLTAKQDRDAIKGWVESTADQGQWKTIDAALPTKQRGEGVLWMPARGILRDVEFPENATFDSSRTPKRGEKISDRKLAPLDLGKLKDRLATVETEAKANDPRALKAEIAKLKAEAAKAPKETVLANKGDVDRAHALGVLEGQADGYRLGFGIGMERALRAAQEMTRAPMAAMLGAAEKMDAACKKLELDLGGANPPPMPKGQIRQVSGSTPAPIVKLSPAARPVAPSAPRPSPVDTGALSRPQATILTSLAWWVAMGHAQPTRVQVGLKARMKARGGHFKTRLSELSGKGLVSYAGADRVALTDAGQAAAPEADMSGSLVEDIRSLLSAPQTKIFDAVRTGLTSRADVAEHAGMDVAGGHFKTRLSELSSWGIVEYPDSQSVALQDWIV